MSDPARAAGRQPGAAPRRSRPPIEIATKIIDDTVARGDRRGRRTRPRPQRTEAIRDSAIVVGAMLLALLLVIAGGAVAGPAAAHAARQRAARWRTTTWRARSNGCAPAASPVPSSRSRCTPPRRSARSRTPSTSCTSRPSCWPVSSPGCSCRSSDMFETLSRRSRSLVDQQLSLIDRLERNEEDPERLESLFRLDHLAARMRRNGANLLVLAGRQGAARAGRAGARRRRSSTPPPPRSRTTPASSPRRCPTARSSASVAGDLVHLLAELLDNALRYSPPISQVRVSAVHTGNGGLVIEVSDIGLGMTESDLRVANTRLQSGGEVNPYTARHMGLFVVGRLAAQHGLVVRLRSTIAGEPNSGTTAGVYVPVELLLGAAGRARPVRRRPEYATPADALRGYRTPLWRSTRITTTPTTSTSAGARVHSTATSTARHVVAAAQSRRQRHLRHPGSSRAGDGTPAGRAACRGRLAGGLDAGADAEPARWGAAGRAGAAAAGARSTPRRSSPPARRSPATVPAPARREPEPSHQRSPAACAAEPRSRGCPARRARARRRRCRRRDLPEDALRVARRSHRLAKSSDLNWESVWDHGWSAAAAAEDAPVAEHTEEGLPVREPGARLVPGAAGVPEARPAAVAPQRRSAQERRRRRRGSIGGRVRHRRARDSGARSGGRPREHQQPLRRRARRRDRTPRRPEETR